MTTDTVEIPVEVLSSVETLDELQDWLTAQNPKIVAELRDARKGRRGGQIQKLAAASFVMSYRVEIGSRRTRNWPNSMPPSAQVSDTQNPGRKMPP